MEQDFFVLLLIISAPLKPFSQLGKDSGDRTRPEYFPKRVLFKGRLTLVYMFIHICQRV